MELFTYSLLAAEPNVIGCEWLLHTFQLEVNLLKLLKETTLHLIDSLVLIADDEVSFIVSLDANVDSSCSSFFKDLHLASKLLN